MGWLWPFIDALGVVQYVVGFWLFLLAPKFRKGVLTGWSKRQPLGKLFIPVEVAVACACGLAPLYLGWAWYVG